MGKKHYQAGGQLNCPIAREYVTESVREIITGEEISL
jgi:hypothetical protein